MVCCGSEDGKIVMWDLRMQLPVQSLLGHTGIFIILFFFLFVTFLFILTKKKTHNDSMHIDVVSCVASNPNKPAVVSCAFDGAVRLWERSDLCVCSFERDNVNKSVSMENAFSEIRKFGMKAGENKKGDEMRGDVDDVEESLNERDIGTIEDGLDDACGVYMMDKYSLMYKALFGNPSSGPVHKQSHSLLVPSPSVSSSSQSKTLASSELYSYLSSSPLSLHSIVFPTYSQYQFTPAKSQNRASSSSNPSLSENLEGLLDAEIEEDLNNANTDKIGDVGTTGMNFFFCG
jgi:WD40 repeat protein